LNKSSTAFSWNLFKVDIVDIATPLVLKGNRERREGTSFLEKEKKKREKGGGAAEAAVVRGWTRILRLNHLLWHFIYCSC
jgi:hypothetical protein